MEIKIETPFSMSPITLKELESIIFEGSKYIDQGQLYGTIHGLMDALKQAEEVIQAQTIEINRLNQQV